MQWRANRAVESYIDDGVYTQAWIQSQAFKDEISLNLDTFDPACKRCYLGKKLASLAQKVLFFSL